jgi:hypothetical protein
MGPGGIKPPFSGLEPDTLSLDDGPNDKFYNQEFLRYAVKQTPSSLQSLEQK